MTNETLVIDTPAGIDAWHKLSQYHALALEIKGLRHSSGRSVYAHIKRMYGLHGNKQSVLDQFADLLREQDILPPDVSKMSDKEIDDRIRDIYQGIDGDVENGPRAPDARTTRWLNDLATEQDKRRHAAGQS